MKPEILSRILASVYKREILLILATGELETPTRILRKMIEGGHRSANKQNVSSNLKWLKNKGLVKVVVDRPKGKLYKITDEGRSYAKKI